MTKKIFLALCLIAALVGVSACGGADGDKADEKSQGQPNQGQPSQGQPSQGPQSPGQQDATKPDLKNIPGVVAEVNGTKINKDRFVQAYTGQFQQMAMQAQTTGQPVDQKKLKKQVAENLVGTELLSQEADDRKFSASEKEINKTLDDAAKQNQMSRKELIAALKKQGMNEKQLMADVKTQVKVDKVIDDETGDAKPTEKELKQLYKQTVQQQKQMGQQSPGQKTPSYEEMKPQLEQQAVQQKQGQVAQKLVTDLRKDAKVKINV